MISKDSKDTEEFEDLPGERLTRLLNLGITSEAPRPIDDLLDRLDEDDGEEWFETSILTGPLSSQGLPEETLMEGLGSLEQFKDINKESRVLLKNAEQREDRLCAMVAYFFSIAGAIVHHDTLITSRSREELDPLFFDLSASVPEPWPNFLARAIAKQPE